MFDTDPVEVALIARIGDLERAKSAAAAQQARLTAELDARRRGAEAARGIPAARQGKGLASEIALARHDSPHEGGRHLGFARALIHEMPHTLGALQTGDLSEWRATLIVGESACLTIEDRRELDRRMCAHPTTLAGKGDTQIAADAKAIAYDLDAQAIVDRAVRAETDRTVTTRPAPGWRARSFTRDDGVHATSSTSPTPPPPPTDPPHHHSWAHPNHQATSKPPSPTTSHEDTPPECHAVRAPAAPLRRDRPTG